MVGTGPDHAPHASRLEPLTHGLDEGLAPVGVEVQGIVAQTQERGLELGHREAGLKEEDGLAIIEASSGDGLGHKAALHGANGGDHAMDGQVHVQKGLDEGRPGLLDLGDAIEWGIAGHDALGNGLLLGLGGDIGYREVGDAELHADELHTQLLFQLEDQAVDLADGEAFGIEMQLI